MKVEIIPAILVKSRTDLLQRIHKVKSYVDTIQIDIMDGIFVPNTTINTKHIAGLTNEVKYEFHWMVDRPEQWIRKVKGDYLHIVHAETIRSFKDVQQAVKEVGGTLGIAINPTTTIEEALPYLKKVDLILVMTVQPGFSGQKYKKEMEDKIRKLRKMFKKKDIEVDGGINLKTAYAAAAAGANRIAASSSIFNSTIISKSIRELRQSAERGCKEWEKKSSG